MGTKGSDHLNQQQFVFAEPLERRELFAAAPAFVQTNLVSDGSVAALHTDTNLADPRGIAIDAHTGKFWIADGASGVATVYDGNGNPSPSASTAPVVTIPVPSGANGSFPGAIVLNTAGSAFTVTSSAKSAPATYLFADETGTIAAYNASVNSTTAVVEVDNSAGGNGAVYKGIAVLGSGKNAELLAANFRTAEIDIFNSQFKPVSNVSQFRDENVPVGYAPFNIQVIDNKVYVAYAKQDASKLSNVAGSGLGYVSVYNAKGILIQRLAEHTPNPNFVDPTNSPWGIAKAPSGFGQFSGDILVGNFGNGTIDAFNRKGQFVGFLSDSSGNIISIDGLWGLAAGTGAHKNALYFTSGPNFESDGLLGTLTLQTKSRNQR